MKKTVLLNIVAIIPGIFVLWFSFSELLGFSAGLSYPEEWMEQLKSGAQLEPRKYWGFKFITLYLPIIILVCVLSLVSVKAGVFLAAVLSTILVLFFYIGPISSLAGDWEQPVIWLVYLIALVPATCVYVKQRMVS